MHSFIFSLAGRAAGSYNAALNKNPLATQCLTSAVLWGVGDVVAQTVEKRTMHMKTPSLLPASPSTPRLPPPPNNESLDLVRVLQTSFFGLAFMGPVGSAWYGSLDRIVASRLPTLAPLSPPFLLAKIGLDALVFSPIYAAAYFCFSAVTSGGGIPEIREKLSNEFIPTMAYETTVWPLVQYLNFSRVPVKHHLNVVNAVSVLDAAMMSYISHVGFATIVRGFVEGVRDFGGKREEKEGGGGGGGGGGSGGGGAGGKKGEEGGDDVSSSISSMVTLSPAAVSVAAARSVRGAAGAYS